MVEEVERIHANLKPRLLRKREVLSKRKIGVPESGPADGPTSEIPGPDRASRRRADRNLRKCSRIQILKCFLMIGSNRISADVVGTAGFTRRPAGSGAG